MSLNFSGAHIKFIICISYGWILILFYREAFNADEMDMPEEIKAVIEAQDVSSQQLKKEL